MIVNDFIWLSIAITWVFIGFKKQKFY
jgi:hypothetical protein